MTFLAAGRVCGRPLVLGDQADITAITYYRAAERFSEAVNGERVRSARGWAAVDHVAALVDDLADNPVLRWRPRSPGRTGSR